MDDIVKRLRAEGEDAMRKHLSLGMHKLCSEAADEIERLRERLADCTKRYTDLLDQLGAGADM